jgi:hypothetical protein
MLIKLQKEQLLSIIEDDVALIGAIKNAVGYVEGGDFLFELQEEFGQYIITRFRVVLEKVNFYYNNTLGKPNVRMSVVVQPTVVYTAPPVIEVPQEVVSETVEEEQQPKGKTRK